MIFDLLKTKKKKTKVYLIDSRLSSTFKINKLNKLYRIKKVVILDNFDYQCKDDYPYNTINKLDSLDDNSTEVLILFTNMFYYTYGEKILYKHIKSKYSRVHVYASTYSNNAGLPLLCKLFKKKNKTGVTVVTDSKTMMDSLATILNLYR